VQAAAEGLPVIGVLRFDAAEQLKDLCRLIGTFPSLQDLAKGAQEKGFTGMAPEPLFEGRLGLFKLSFALVENPDGVVAFKRAGRRRRYRFNCKMARSLLPSFSKQTARS
jgi:hypothetical protein